jgi:hypothetical protein
MGEVYKATDTGLGREARAVSSLNHPHISTAGGKEPRWRRDGKELYYVAGNKIVAVEVKTDSATFEAGIPKELFEVRMAPQLRNRILVTGDGKRFLVNTPVEDTLALPMTVVLNFAAGARR